MRLEDLNLTDLGVAVRAYRTLFHHRTVFLEGIRRIAARNMIHLAEARDHCAAFSSSADEDDWVTRVQSKMLSDQGLDDSEMNRAVLQGATFLPLQTYLALLYAEIECVRKSRNESPFFEDDGLFPYLDEREEAISRLRRFRDSFLHPHSASARLEMGFLTYGPSYNVAPEMQAILDEYLSRVRWKLVAALKTIFAALPGVQRVYCLSRAWMVNSERMEHYQDLAGMEHVVTQVEKLTDEMEEAAEDIKSWSPTDRQTQTARTLSDYWNDVSPSGPEQRYENPTTRQTPMNPALLAPLLSGSGGPERYGKSRAGIHAIRNAALIGRLLFTTAMLLNEGITWQGELSLEQLRQMGPKAQVNALRARGLQSGDVIVAPSRVSAALLYEPLRLYSQMEHEDASVRDDGLADLASRLGTLRRFRNSVFHVLDHTRGSPASLDVAITDPGFDIVRLYTGLAAFFGPRLPPDRRSESATRV